MMRITEISRSESVRRFRLEGRLTQVSAGDLLATVDPLVAAGATVYLDLADVTFADNAAIEILVALRERGVILAAASSFLIEMLRAGRAAPRQATPTSAGTANADAILLARLRGGDEAAFAELVESNARRLLATTQRLLRNEDDASDAVQEAFMAAFKGLAAFNGEAKLSTWLHRIAVNAALMRLRSRRQRAERSIDDLLPRFAEDDSWAEQPGRSAESSEALLERRETRAMVRRCIDQLPTRYRTVLLMRDIEDLDTDEVAELLDITPNAAKIRLHRARQALRTLIEAELASVTAGGSTAAAAQFAHPA